MSALGFRAMDARTTRLGVSLVLVAILAGLVALAPNGWWALGFFVVLIPVAFAFAHLGGRATGDADGSSTGFDCDGRRGSRVPSGGPWPGPAHGAYRPGSWCPSQLC